MDTKALGVFLEHLQKQVFKDFDWSDAFDCVKTNLENVYDEFVKAIIDGNWKDVNLEELSVSVEKILKENIPAIKSSLESGIMRLKNTYQEKVENELIPTISGIKDSFNAQNRILVYDIETISLQNIREYMQQNMVAGSRFAAAYKTIVDGYYVIYLTYLDSNKEILPTQQNLYIALVAPNIGQDVKDLFGNLSLTLLK